MNQEEMKKEFHELYDLMSNSKKVENMRTFGTVHKEMMDWMIQNKPDLAAEWIGKLESVKWKNYLTPSEAERIVSEMSPEAPWSRDAWNKAMDNAGMEKEEIPYYNPCALYVTMNAVYSDHAKSIANIMGMTLDEIPAEALFHAIYLLAVDKLKDKDQKVSIRHAYSL